MTNNPLYTEAYLNGYHAFSNVGNQGFFSYNIRTNNPYPEDSNEYYEWREGFSHADQDYHARREHYPEEME